VANEYDNDQLEDMLARLIELERQVKELKHSLSSDNLRYLDKQLKLKGML
jgi:hypothetical protein